MTGMDQRSRDTPWRSVALRAGAVAREGSPPIAPFGPVEGTSPLARFRRLGAGDALGLSPCISINHMLVISFWRLRVVGRLGVGRRVEDSLLVDRARRRATDRHRRDGGRQNQEGGNPD